MYLLHLKFSIWKIKFKLIIQQSITIFFVFFIHLLFHFKSNHCVRIKYYLNKKCILSSTSTKVIKITSLIFIALHFISNYMYKIFFSFLWLFFSNGFYVYSTIRSHVSKKINTCYMDVYFSISPPCMFKYFVLKAMGSLHLHYHYLLFGTKNINSPCLTTTWYFNIQDIHHGLQNNFGELKKRWNLCWIQMR